MPGFYTHMISSGGSGIFQTESPTSEGDANYLVKFFEKIDENNQNWAEKGSMSLHLTVSLNPPIIYRKINQLTEFFFTGRKGALRSCKWREISNM